MIMCHSKWVLLVENITGLWFGFLFVCLFFGVCLEVLVDFFVCLFIFVGTVDLLNVVKT